MMIKIPTTAPPTKADIIEAQDFGVILHQPLNLSIFRKNSVFGRKMNGPPVSPCRILQNAPTWRVRKHNFRPPFLPPIY